jgi:hypothetical protein
MPAIPQSPVGSCLVIIGRWLPNGSHVLIPKTVLPRTCRRLDGVVKVAFDSRAEAKAARTKHDVAYRCRHCARFHLATKHRRKPPISEAALPRAIA